jgi:PPOX class probable F420-dependent enzyme
VPVPLDADTRAFLSRHRVAHLATADAAGAPHVVPLCYAVDEHALYFVVDAKPKRHAGTALKRMRNIAANPAVAFVVDDYDEEWSALAYVLVRGRAAIVDEPEERDRALALLRERYPQYRPMALVGPDHPVVRITPEHVHRWQAAQAALAATGSVPRRGGSETDA